MPSAPPAAVLARLALAGLAGPIRIKPSPGHCKKCGMAVLAALEYFGYASGPPVVVDAVPISIAAEIQCALIGIATFRHYKGECLIRRGWGEYATGPGNSSGIVASHFCGVRHQVDLGAERPPTPTPPANRLSREGIIWSISRNALAHKQRRRW